LHGDSSGTYENVFVHLQVMMKHIVTIVFNDPTIAIKNVTLVSSAPLVNPERKENDPKDQAGYTKFEGNYKDSRKEETILGKHAIYQVARFNR
jgi:hypothetical protein